MEVASECDCPMGEALMHRRFVHFASCSIGDKFVSAFSHPSASAFEKRNSTRKKRNKS